jgi:hypothetical protein
MGCVRIRRQDLVCQGTQRGVGYARVRRRDLVCQGTQRGVGYARVRLGLELAPVRGGTGLDRGPGGPEGTWRAWEV